MFMHFHLIDRWLFGPYALCWADEYTFKPTIVIYNYAIIDKVRNAAFRRFAWQIPWAP
jgi:hypothetical protein